MDCIGSSTLCTSSQFSRTQRYLPAIVSSLSKLASFGEGEIRHVSQLPSPRMGTAPSQIDGLANQTYDIATFATWSATLRDRLRCEKHVVNGKEPEILTA